MKWTLEQLEKVRNMAPEMAEAILTWDEQAEWHGGDDLWELRLQTMAQRLRQILEIKE